mmetsp:Transcript_141228/g.316667  ORF Transcript_141228/g.316667 Transcript_141228/m.316667 type:complete len:262 (-) Transcript_141228:721-1506(-)
MGKQDGKRVGGGAQQLLGQRAVEGGVGYQPEESHRLQKARCVLVPWVLGGFRCQHRGSGGIHPRKPQHVQSLQCRYHPSHAEHSPPPPLVLVRLLQGGRQGRARAGRGPRDALLVPERRARLQAPHLRAQVRHALAPPRGAVHLGGVAGVALQPQLRGAAQHRADVQPGDRGGQGRVLRLMTTVRELPHRLQDVGQGVTAAAGVGLPPPQNTSPPEQHRVRPHRSRCKIFRRRLPSADHGVKAKNELLLRQGLKPSENHRR